MVELLGCPFCGAGLQHAPTLSTRKRQAFVHPPGDSSCLGERFVIHEDDAERWNTRAPDPRIAELEARADRAEAQVASFERSHANQRLRWREDDAFKTLDRIRARLAGLSPQDCEPIADAQSRILEAEAHAERAEKERIVAEAEIVVQRARAADAEAELARLRAAGTFNQGIEAGVVAGWEACRRSVYAVCEDIGDEADRNRSDLENPPRHHFGRGEGDAAKRIARAFNSMNARDDDNVIAAFASLHRPENEEGG